MHYSKTFSIDTSKFKKNIFQKLKQKIGIVILKKKTTYAHKNDFFFLLKYCVLSVINNENKNVSSK